MADMDGERMDPSYQFLHPFHGDYHHPHTSSRVQGAESYKHFLWREQHVLFELKVAVMVLVGAVVVVACVVYIVLQCRSEPGLPGHHPRGLREDNKMLFGSTETLDNLIPADDGIRLKILKDQEFFV